MDHCQSGMVRLKEPIGMAVEQLPRLAAVIGGHGVIDHWNLTSLSGYPYKREAVPVELSSPRSLRPVDFVREY